MIGVMVAQYRILAEIGRGSMGIVFKAQDTVTGRLAALKIIAEKLVNDPQMLHRFEREGITASALHHPNICTVYDSGDWQGRPYFAMELLEGQTLDERLAAMGPLPAQLVIEIGVGVAGALEATHAIGVIHRDIKPANLFLSGAGVKVLDFGLAKVRLPQKPVGEDSTTAAMSITSHGFMVGTLAYMSPEQVRSEPLDGRSDLYSLGIVLYESATGELPVHGSSTPKTLPAGLAPVIAKLTAMDANSRYRTAREAREALQNCVPGREAFERRAL
jgi:serine/threonine protein kinase